MPISKHVVPSRSLRLLIVIGFAISPMPVAAQQFTAGVKVGAQVNDALTSQVSSAVPGGGATAPTSFDHFILGPTIDVGVKYGFRVGFDALHTHYAYTLREIAIPPSNGFQGATELHIGSWQFPLVLNWRSPEPSLHPFIGGGASIRHTGGSAHVHGAIVPPFAGFGGPGTPVDFTESATTFLRPGTGFLNTWTAGAVITGGITFHVHYFYLSPELRYTHWTDPGVGVVQFAESNDVFNVFVGFSVGRH